MDCPSEEQLIRTALAGLDIDRLAFDLPARSLVVWHRADVAAIAATLERLNLGAALEGSEIVSSETIAGDSFTGNDPAPDPSGGLRLVLAINLAMFVVEAVAGVLAESTGLLADSLDMLADAGVYAIALWAVGRAQRFQLTAARVSGWLQLALALGVLAEVVRRALTGSAPEPPAMLAVAALALAANVTCLAALARHRDGGAHLQASWIFTTTDVIANLGVLVAGALVSWTGSAVPDLVVGALVGLLVLRGAARILGLTRAGAAEP